MHVTSQLNYSTIMLPSQKIHNEKQNNFVIYLFNYFSKSSRKVATANPFVFERAKVTTSCKFATSPDILVAKGKI